MNSSSPCLALTFILWSYIQKCSFIWIIKVHFLDAYIFLFFSGNTTIMDIDNEDSMDAPSVSSTDGAVTPIIMSTPVTKKVNNKTV